MVSCTCDDLLLVVQWKAGKKRPLTQTHNGTNFDIIQIKSCI